MKIASSNISMSADYDRLEQHVVEEKLTVWIGNRNGSTPLVTPDVDTITLSKEAQSHLIAKQEKLLDVDKSNGVDPKLMMLKKMLEKLFGVKIRVLQPEEMECRRSEETSTQVAQTANVQAGPAGWGVEYEYHESYYESQELSFSAEGIIRTKDGREINFAIQLSVSSEFLSQTDFTFRAGDAVKVDPLVINFNGLASELTDTKFDFDLDSDGDMEQISFVKSGSGFLALDVNGDGKINNGSELFGPNTGNGFAELAVHDLDGNRWIDESDSVYDRLQVWTKQEDGTDTLSSLRELGIGAIYLDPVNARFDIKNSMNQLTGQTNRLGIYLNENGTVGIVQQIDLVV